ncbi:hypothetical protein GCM10027072_62740 [Streptomyces bullii]
MSPPMPSMTRHSASGEASTTRSRQSVYRLPPAQSGSVGSGSLGAPGTEADDQRVVTWASRTRCSASRTASSKPIGWPGGSGTYRAMSCSRQTTSWRSDSVRGRAMVAGTGVTSPTQWLDRPGVSTGTGRMRRRGRPATAA